MKVKHVKFPSIEQYRNIVKHINHSASFVGLDKNGEPIYDGLLPKPTLKLNGTVKIHGSQGAVCLSGDEMYVQSRKNIITPEKDNCGFACFVHGRKDSFMDVFCEIAGDFAIDVYSNTISIFGEVSGSNIQKGVGVNGLDKMFIIFDVKITPDDEEKEAYWLDMNEINIIKRYVLNENNIHFINDFPTFEMEIDFNKPEAFQNALNEITLKVEEKCPVAFHFGKEGAGEGVVWKGEYKGSFFRFKVKGDKHSKSKVKKLPEVDDEKVALVNDVVNKITPAFRLEQGIQETFDTLNGGEIDRKGMGDYIRWVIGDIVKEDLDIITDAGLDVKEVNNKVSKVVRDYFFQMEQM